MNQKKEYDMLKLRVPESSIAYLKFSSDETPQVKVTGKRDENRQEAFLSGYIMSGV